MCKGIALFVWLLTLAGGTALCEDWHKSFPISNRPELRVETRDGAVNVRAWDQKSISVQVLAPGWTIGRGELEIVERKDGDRVEVTVRTPTNKSYFGRHNIRVEVQVPRDTKLDVRTGDGAIRVTDIAGETRLSTGDGRIDCMAVDGVLAASTGDGSISVKGRFESLQLRTGDGSIDASLMPGSKLTQGGRLETGDGSVTVRLANDLAADLDLHTGDGSLKVGVPMSTSSERGKRSLRGKLNGGGPMLKIRSGDGALRIDRL